MYGENKTDFFFKVNYELTQIDRYIFSLKKLSIFRKMKMRHTNRGNHSQMEFENWY